MLPAEDFRIYAFYSIIWKWLQKQWFCFVFCFRCYDMLQLCLLQKQLLSTFVYSFIVAKALSCLFRSSRKVLPAGLFFLAIYSIARLAGSLRSFGSCFHRIYILFYPHDTVVILVLCSLSPATLEALLKYQRQKPWLYQKELARFLKEE